MQPETTTLNGLTILRGGNRLTGNEEALLTGLGREMYAAVGNPYLLALADVVARAEGTDFGGQQHFGYTTIIGGGVVTNLSTHPFVGTGRATIAGSTAAGRYQQLAWDGGPFEQTDHGQVFRSAPTFSPAVQDVVFAYSLYKRGVFEDVVVRNQPAAGLLVRGGNPSIDGLTTYAPLSAEYASLENENGLGFYSGQGTAHGLRSDSLPFLQQRLAVRLGQAPSTGPTTAPPRPLPPFNGRYSDAPAIDQVRRNAAPLRVGHRGESVGQVQDLLIAQGFLRSEEVGSDRGYFGPKTQTAVYAFQRANRLTPPPGREGEVGATTLASLERAAQRPNMPTSSAPPTSAPRPTPPTNGGGGNQPSSGPPTARTIVELSSGRVLREGAEGPAVVSLQEQLVRTGHMTQAQVDSGRGIFGPQTKAAVESFQRQNNLAPPPGQEGAVGQTTWTRLINSPANSARPASGRTTGGTGGQGFYFPIDAPYEGPSAAAGQVFGSPRPGRTHAGIDFTPPFSISDAEAFNINIFAYRGGTVVEGDDVGFLGIEHDDGTQARYVHNSQHLVRVGDRVKAGDVIAKMGNVATAAIHLHFEFYDTSGAPIDPAPLLLDANNNPRQDLIVVEGPYGRPRGNAT